MCLFAPNCFTKRFGVIETATRRPPHPGGRQLDRLRWTYWEWNFGSKLGFLRNWKSNGFGTFFDFPYFFIRVRFLIDCETRFEYIWFKNRYQVETGSRRSISGDFLRFWKQSNTESYMYFIFCQQNLKSMEFSSANLIIFFLTKHISSKLSKQTFIFLLFCCSIGATFQSTTYSDQIEAKSSQVLYIVYGFEVSFWRGRSGFVDRSSVLEVQVRIFLRKKHFFQKYFKKKSVPWGLGEEHQNTLKSFFRCGGIRESCEREGKA